MADQLTDKELNDIDQYLAGTSAADEAQVKGWLRRLREGARHRDGQPASSQAHLDEPLKLHGDALLDGSGTRHGLLDTE